MKLTSKQATKYRWIEEKRFKKDTRVMAVIDSLAQAIQKIEGYYPPGGNYPSGSVAYRNNNPGNLRFANQSGATGQDSQGFAIFDNYGDGYSALQNQISLDASRGLTLSEFVNKYAPPSENNTSSYLNQVSDSTGISPSETLLSALGGSGGSVISTLSSSVGDWVDSVISDVPNVISDPGSVSVETWVTLGTLALGSLLLLKRIL